MFKPLVDIRARIYDMAARAGDRASHDLSTRTASASPSATSCRAPSRTGGQARAPSIRVLEDIGGVVTRVGDETVGEMWSLYDGQDVLNEIDPRFSENIAGTSIAPCTHDPFHVSANTDPKGDRSKRPQEQDPDMLLHVVKETDAGIVVRGAKYETAAAYANQAFVKPTIANWGDSELSDYARRLHRAHGRAGHEAHLPHRLRRARARPTITRSPTGSTRSTRWSSSTTC